MTTDASTIPSGYSTDVVLFATRYKQGGRTVYSLDLSLAQIDAMITEPDPNIPQEGNRAIRPAHAEAFGKYLRAREDWVAPGLLLRTPNTFKFDIQQEVGGTEFGILTLPRRALGDLHIIDGQHRILGVITSFKSLKADIDRASSNLATARRIEQGGKGEQDARDRLDALRKVELRLENERIAVQIHVESDPARYKQMFFDIAENALSITASTRVRFDSRKVVNRALGGMYPHPLILGRVDIDGDRIRGDSQFIMSAKHVAEIVRTVNVGLDGRVSRRQEEELNEAELIQRTNEFFDIMLEAFPVFKAMSLGQVLPGMIRKTSLLGSVTMVRAFGGVFYDLITTYAWSKDRVEDFFAKMAPHTSAPTYVGDIWTSEMPSIFSIGVYGPSGRRQDLTSLKDTITAWALDKAPFLDGPPKPRPVEGEHEIVTEEEDPGFIDLGMDDPTKPPVKPKPKPAAKK